MKQKHSIDTVFALALFCLFAVMALLVLSSGIRTYRGIEESMQSHYDQRTALSYIASKVRHYDAAGSVSVGDFGGENALCLREEIDGYEFCTWIYEYDGQIYELFTEPECELTPDCGEAILSADSLEFEREGDLIYVQCTGVDGAKAELCLALRSGVSE